MARRRRKSPTDAVRRDLITPITSYLLPQREPLRAFEDRREFHFEPDPFPEIFNPQARASIIVSPRARARVEHRSPRYVHEGFRNPPSRLAFAEPSRVAVCARREQRREVMFAKKKAGKRGQRKARWNAFSSYSCKR